MECLAKSLRSGGGEGEGHEEGDGGGYRFLGGGVEGVGGGNFLMYLCVVKESNLSEWREWLHIGGTRILRREGNEQRVQMYQMDL